MIDLTDIFPEKKMYDMQYLKDSFYEDLTFVDGKLSIDELPFSLGLSSVADARGVNNDISNYLYLLKCLLDDEILVVMLPPVEGCIEKHVFGQYGYWGDSSDKIVRVIYDIWQEKKHDYGGPNNHIVSFLYANGFDIMWLDHENQQLVGS